MNLTRLLDRVERAGNRLPHPTMLFIYLCGFIAVISAITTLLNLSATHPITGELISAKNLISAEGLHFILQNTATNFTSFAPVGSVLLAILGIGIAEHSGLISSVLRLTVLKAPRQLTTFIIVATSVLSSIALDTGYVVLIPLAAMVFQAQNRNPLAGIVAAFAGVSGGFSANIVIGPVDAVLAGISTEAAQLIDPNYQVNAAGNYFFILFSTFLIGILGTLITEKVALKWLPEVDSHSLDHSLAEVPNEKQALRAVGIFSIIFLALLLIGALPEDGILRNPENGDLLRSPFISGIVVIISVYAAISGWIFHRVSSPKKTKEHFLVTSMEKHISAMSSYIVLMFFAAQFVNYFGWSQLGAIFAINGAEALAETGLPKTALLIVFVFLAAGINLFIGSASAKWALIAPIFVPMFLLNGISPEATQTAYRIGDSSTNIITPLMPYFGVVVAFAQKYKQDIGLGTLISLMLPYSICFLIFWTASLWLWAMFDFPLGPGANILLSAP
jgi:aminobenzoyl-glutamate transport protein